VINLVLSSFVRFSDVLAQSRLVVVPAAAGVAEVARITDAANAALLRLVALARERADAFKVCCVCNPLALNVFLILPSQKFDWFTPAINPTFTGAAAPSLDAMTVLVRSLFAAVPPQVFSCGHFSTILTPLLTFCFLPAHLSTPRRHF
jgi:hypothetical protein